ncbi:helix-turn-helix domain-containing protein [Actinomadura hibisca]|uniref:helix-turn-helix domain-containing protein n=1 Tax=Actinomadura hibisca TaxID=68565 RepID=UPI00082F2A6E|nr:helix-turn-helix transcriptional regulator [Actinomadura hibisca]
MAPLESLNPDASFKHWIASDLRFYRETLGLSLAQLGQVMKCSRHTVSNIEHARDGWNLNEDQAERLDAFLKLNGHFARLVRYARTAHDPDWFPEYAKYEAKALEIRTYRLSLIPGILQTPEYARALFAGCHMVEDIEAEVEARMKRQEIFRRKKPPLLWVLLDESILYRVVGGVEVMRGQLARLRAAIESPHVVIRIVPHSADCPLALEGSFNRLTLEGSDMTFVDAPGGGRLVQVDTEVREYGIRWDRIGACALPWESSRDSVERAMERFG